jgi:endonuclease-3
VDSFGGQIPRSIAELTQLPGVARKTSNVVLGSAFGINEGVVVDTHVGRLSRRLGLTKAADPVKVEQDLMKLVPQAEWALFSHMLIFHGRAICIAQRPACAACTLQDVCPSAFANGATAPRSKARPRTRPAKTARKS